MTIICGIHRDTHVLLGCDSWVHHVDPETNFAQFDEFSKKYNVFSNKAFQVGIVQSGYHYVYGDESRDILFKANDYIKLLYGNNKFNLDSFNSFVTSFENTFVDELSLAIDIILERYGEENFESYRNVLIFKFLIGGQFNGKLGLASIELITKEKKVDINTRIIPRNSMYSSGSELVTNYPKKIDLYFRKGGKFNKDKSLLKEYMRDVVNFDKDQHPGNEPEFIGRTVGGPVFLTTIRNKRIVITEI